MQITIRALERQLQIQFAERQLQILFTIRAERQLQMQFAIREERQLQNNTIAFRASCKINTIAIRVETIANTITRETTELLLIGRTNNTCSDGRKRNREWY